MPATFAIVARHADLIHAPKLRACCVHAACVGSVCRYNLRPTTHATCMPQACLVYSITHTRMRHIQYTCHIHVSDTHSTRVSYTPQTHTVHVSHTRLRHTHHTSCTHSSHKPWVCPHVSGSSYTWFIYNLTTSNVIRR
jgi:hypothetical protein